MSKKLREKEEEKERERESVCVCVCVCVLSLEESFMVMREECLEVGGIDFIFRGIFSHPNKN